MDIRYSLTDSMRKHRKDREVDRAKDRGDYALTELQVKQVVHSPVEELTTARRDTVQLNKEVSSLRIQTDRLERERKNPMYIPECKIYLHRWEMPRTKSTGGDFPRKI